MQVFKSMADVKSLILVGAVAARRFIHIEDLALKKTMQREINLLISNFSVESILIFFTQVQKV